MRKLLTFLVALAAIVFAIQIAPTHAFGCRGWPQIAGGNGCNSSIASGASYTGPGDSQTFLLWGSVARVYNLAKASTSTSLADLVQGPSGASPGTAVCTLRGTTAGTVDLTAYCPGSVTPAAACAAVTGGVCTVSKLYDQAGATPNPWTQATVANQPTLTFSAINGLPAMTFSSASSTRMSTGSALSQTQPYTFEAVANQSADNGDGTLMSAASSLFFAYNVGVSGQIAIYGGGSSAGTATAASPQYHVMQGAYADTASTINVDGVQTTPGQPIGTGSANLVLFLGSNSSLANLLDGHIAEVGVYAGAYNAGVQSYTRTAYGL